MLQGSIIETDILRYLLQNIFISSIFFSLVEFGSISEVTKDDESSSFYLETLNHHGYHGLINEDETNVVVTPTIKVYITVSIYLANSCNHIEGFIIINFLSCILYF